MNELFAKEMALITQETMEGLGKRTDTPIYASPLPPLNNQLLEQIRNIEMDALRSIVGDSFAEKLKLLCVSIDFEHPALPVSMLCGFAEHNPFAKTLTELMLLAQITKDKSLDSLANLIQNSLNNSKEFKEARNSIVKPPVRCISSYEERIKARSAKGMKVVDLKEWHPTAAKTWNGYPSTFRMFVRMTDYIEKERSASERRAKKFEVVGANHLAASVGKSVDQLKSLVGEQYIGFNKIKMVDAALILAKFHQASLNAGGDVNNILSVPRKLFEGTTNFWLEEAVRFPIRKDGRRVQNPPITPKHRMNAKSYIMPEQFTFTPRAYPLHEFAAKCPEHIEKAVKVCEAHPDLNNKVAFDHYWVIVPGVTLTEESHLFGGLWCIRPGTAQEIDIFDNKDDAERSLDVTLTDNGSVHPILLGEKDGRCYFIAVW